MKENTPFGELNHCLNKQLTGVNTRSTDDQQLITEYSDEFIDWFTSTSYPTTQMHAYFIGWEAAQRHKALKRRKVASKCNNK